MNLATLISSISDHDVVEIQAAVACIKFEPWNIMVGEDSLEDIKLPVLIAYLCRLKDFNHHSASGKALIMTLWTTVRKRICPTSVHCSFDHSITDLHLVEIIYSHLIKSHVESTWYRSITTWFSLIYRTEEDVLGIAADSIQEYLDIISNGDTPKLLDLVKTISPFFTLPHLNSWSLLHYACSLKDMSFRIKEIIDILVHSGLNINAVDATGQTPMHIAAQHCNHAAVLALSQWSHTSTTVRDRRDRTALDVLAESFAKKRHHCSTTPEKIVTMITLILPSNEWSSLWNLWKCDENHPRKYKECSLYYIVGNCDEQVGSDVLTLSSSASSFSSFQKHTIVEMVICCIIKRKLKVLARLLHMFLRCETERCDKIADGMGIQTVENFYEACKYYNIFMIVATQQRFKEATILLLEICWPIVAKYLESNEISTVLLVMRDFPKCFRHLFSRFHVYALYNNIEPFQHELKELSHRNMIFLLFGIHDEENNGQQQFTTVKQWLGERNADSHTPFINHFSRLLGRGSMDIMTQYPLLVWSCITHGDPKYLWHEKYEWDGKKQKNENKDEVTGFSKDNVYYFNTINQSASGIMDILLRKLYAVVDGDVLNDSFPNIQTLLCQSIYFSFLCGNMKSIDILQSFLGLSSFGDLLTKRNMDGKVDTRQPLLKDLYTLCTFDYIEWQLKSKKNFSWRTIGCPQYLKKCLKFTQAIAQSSILSSEYKMPVFSQIGNIDHQIIKNYHTLKSWLQEHFPSIVDWNTAAPIDIFKAFSDMISQGGIYKDIAEYYNSRLVRWNEVDILVNDKHHSFMVGMRKILKNFPPDEKWLKIAYLFQLYLDVLASSFILNDANEGNADIITQGVTIEKRDWEKFVKLIAQAMRSHQAKVLFVSSILSMRAFPLSLSSNSHQDNVNWSKIFGNGNSKAKWELFVRLYSKEVPLKVILHRKNVVSGRRSIFDCDFESEKKTDKSIAFVYKTLTALLEAVYYDGVSFSRLFFNPTRNMLEESNLKSSFFQGLQIVSAFDNMHYFSQSRPPLLLDSSSDEPCYYQFTAMEDGVSLLGYAIPSLQDSSSNTILDSRSKYGQLFTMLEDLRWSQSSTIRSSTSNNNTSIQNRICDEYEKLQYACNITYKDLLHELVNLSSATHSDTHQLSFIIPLCLLKCYDVAEKILKKFINKNESLNTGNSIRSNEMSISPEDPPIDVEMHHQYWYISRQKNESIPCMIGRLLEQHLQMGAVSSSIDDVVYQISPILLALLDGNHQFISTYFRCFPKFPLAFAQLYDIIDELQLYDAGAKLFSELFLYKADDFGPLGSIVVQPQPLSSCYSSKRCDPQIHTVSHRNHAAIKGFYRLLCIQANECYLNRKVVTPLRKNYSTVDKSFLYDYLMESSCSTLSENKDSTKMHLMDGTRISINAVKNNRYLLMRALPSPPISPGFYKKSLTLLHLLAANGLFDSMELLIKSNPDWIFFLDFPDKSGYSPLYHCLFHQQYPLVQKWLELQISHTNNQFGVQLISSDVVKKIVGEIYRPKFSLVKWIQSYNKNAMIHLRSKQASLDVALTRSDPGHKIFDSISTFRIATKGIHYDSLLQKLSLMLQYTHSLWEVITQRDFIKFVHFSVSSSLWSKMDSIVRARQVLTILGIPYSYLTNATTATNSSAGSHSELETAQNRSRTIFEFEPHALLQKITPSIQNQLKYLISGWFRTRLCEARKIQPNSIAAAISDCLFTYHLENENCIQFGLRLASKVKITKNSMSLNSGNSGKSVILDEESRAMVMKELVRIEMMSNMENSVGNGNYGWNISDAAGKYVDELYDALQSAFLLIEFARCLCSCRLLTLASFEKKNSFKSDKMERLSRAFIGTNDNSISIQSGLRFKHHPLHLLNQQLQHHEKQLQWLSRLSSQKLTSGLSHRLQLLDLLLPSEFRSFLKFNPAYSKRVSILKEILCDGLMALMMDLGKPQYCELLTRLLLSSRFSNSTTVEAFPNQASGTATSISKNHNGILSDDIGSLEIVLQMLCSLEVKDFWFGGGSRKKFMQVFESLIVRPSASLDGQLLVDIIRILKNGELLDITDDEEQNIEVMFSAMNPDLKLTTFRREQMIHEVIDQLRITLKVSSELYWFLTSIYGLLSRSRANSSSSKMDIFEDEFSEDLSINVIASNHCDPRLMLAKPHPFFENFAFTDRERKCKINWKSCHNISYSGCLDKIFHLVVRENHMETTLKLIQQAVVFGNFELLKQNQTALRIIGATPSLQKDVEYLVFYALMLCPVDCSKVLEESFKIHYDHALAPTIQLFDQYCKCIHMLLTHRFPISSPRNHAKFSTIDLALIKKMPWDIISKIISVGPSPSTVGNTKQDGVHIFSLPNCALTSFFLHNYHDCERDTQDVNNDKRTILRKWLMPSDSPNTSPFSLQLKFSITNTFRGCGGDSHLDPIIALGNSIFDWFKTIECSEIDVKSQFGSQLGRYIDVTFKRALVPFVQKNFPMGKSLFLSDSQLRSICPFVRDIHRFLSTGIGDYLNIQGEFEFRYCWSMVDLVLLLQDCDLMECYISNEILSYEENEGITALKNYLLQLIIRNDVRSIRFICELTKLRMTESCWSRIINEPFTWYTSDNQDKNGNTISFNLVDKVCEFHDRQSILLYLLNQRLHVSFPTIMKGICGRLATEEMACIVTRSFVENCDDHTEIDALKSIREYYDHDLERNLLLNQDTVFHVICRRGYTKLAALFLDIVYQVKSMTIDHRSTSTAFFRNSTPSLQVAKQDHNCVEDESFIVHSLNCYKESPLSISIAMGYRALTKLLGNYCPPHIHQAARLISYFFRLFALNRRAIKEKYMLHRSSRRIVTESNDDIEEYAPLSSEDDDY